MRISVSDLAPKSPVDLSAITLKKYPAQYALQPLIAAACNAHQLGRGAARGIEKVVVHASRRTVERTADPAKYVPSGPEAADHSLPFCIAVALMDGQFTAAALQSGRWADPETLALMARIVALPIGSATGYATGRQAMELHFHDATAVTMPCSYPPDGETPRGIAERKLREASQGLIDADGVLDLVLNLEGEPDLGRLAAALSRGHLGQSPRR
jgi:2-methylcitrate dehydratase